MSLKFYNFKPRKTLYDGKENGFYDFSEKIYIPCLNHEVEFTNTNAMPLWNVSSSLKEKIVSNISGLRVLTCHDDPEPSYKYNDLDVYIYTFFLESKKVHIVLAEGESQPARYKIILLGLVMVE